MPAVPLRRNHSPSPSPFFCHASHRFGSLFLPKRCPKPRRDGNSLSGSSRVHHPPPWVLAEEDGCTSAEKRVFKNHPSLRKGGDFRHSSNSHKRKEGAMKKIMEIPPLHTRGRRRENSSPISPPLPFALLFKCTQRWEWVLGARFGCGEGGGQEATLGNYFPVLSPSSVLPKRDPPSFGARAKRDFSSSPLRFRPTAIFSW